MLGGTEETMPYIKWDCILHIIWGMGGYFLSAFCRRLVRNDGAPKLGYECSNRRWCDEYYLDYVFVFPCRVGNGRAAIATVIGSCLLWRFCLCTSLRRRIS